MITFAERFARRCPRCKGTELRERILTTAGGERAKRAFALWCAKCYEAIPRFEVYDTEADEVIAVSSYDGELMPVRWAKKPFDESKLSGRDREGMGS